MLNSAPPVINFDLYNLEDTAGFTADMVIGETVFESGDPLFFVGGLTQGGTVAPGGTTQGQAVMITSTLGSLAASWTVAVRDPALPGVATEELTINLTGEIIASVPGDIDGDGDVDGADISAFFVNFTGPGNGPPADPGTDMDGDGDVDGADISAAFVAFTGPLAPTRVPEPASLALLGIGCLIVSRRRDRSRN